jgi:D-arabinose 1-dehydrogenase-like Zn-dependent alcohol dehydrogenase
MTVFTPMKKFGVGEGSRVGIAGIGGLGHLAIQFASKMGAQVVVFSTSENKREEAMKFGAAEFYVSSNLTSSKPEKGLDFLVVTGTKFPDWDVFFPLLNHHAQILLVGFSPEQLTLPFWPLMMKEVSVHGCLTSTPSEFAAMLEFAAEHDVRPLIEEFPMTETGVAQAVEKLEKGTIRYRGVLVA